MVTHPHYVNGNEMRAPYPDGMEIAMFGMGCFWGAERLFWQIPEIYVTAVGYSAGNTMDPTYEQVCSGQTGHNEVVRVVFDPLKIDYAVILKVFWEGHDPTQGMRQGNDMGTQYRSGIYCGGTEQEQQAIASSQHYQTKLTEKRYGRITTEIKPADKFYYAEPYHQQYLAKNPAGYCGMGGTGALF